MKFPGPITFLAAATVIAAIVTVPHLAGLFPAGPDIKENLHLADTEMAPEPPLQPEQPPVVAADRDPPRPVEPQPVAKIEPSPGPPAKAEPPTEQVARLDPVGSLQPVSAPPKPMDLAEKLPDEAKRTFELLLSEGNRLHDAKQTTPAYTAIIPVEMADRLIGQGVFRSGVTQGDRRLFVFAQGGLSDARSPRLAGAGDTKGFSSRVIALDRRSHALLVTQVATKFGIASNELTPCLLVRAQLDRVVLATQHRAATRHGLVLRDLAYTVGRFECAAGIPFVYTISELRGKDGSRLSYGGETPTGSPAGGAAAFSGNVREPTSGLRGLAAQVPGA